MTDTQHLGAWKFSASDDSLEIMVQFPNGTVQFMGVWATFKLLWKLLITERKLNHVVYLNGERV